MRAQPPWVRGWAGMCFLLSGAIALVHQMVWTRRLVDVLGASSSTFSQVIGAFFVGLAIGAAWVALRPGSPATGLARAARAECAVAVLALPALMAVPLADWLRSSISMASIKAVLGPVLLLPPSIAMGMVLPAALPALRSRGGSPSILMLYGWNTLGGVIGILLAVFAGIPAFGLSGTGLAACLGNLIVAIGLWKLGKGLAKSEAASEENADEQDRVPIGTETLALTLGRVELAGLGFISGLLVLCLEVLLQHQVAQVSINSTFSSAFVLVFVLLGLGAASWGAHLGLGEASKVPRRIVITLGMCAAVTAMEPWLFHGFMPGLRPIPYTLPPALYFGRLCGLGLVTVLPLLFVTGLLFPWLLRLATSTRAVAGLLAWNGIGGWIGSELADGFVGPHFGLWRGAGLCAVVYGLAGVWLGWRLRSRMRSASAVPVRAMALAIGGCLLGGLTLRSGWRLPSVGASPEEQVISMAVGREGVVATVVRDTNDWRILFNNTYTLGGSRAAANQERQAHLPLLLHGKARTVGVLGVATGSTLAGVTLHDEVERITAAELSPLALAMARQHFEPFNRGALKDPRVEVVVEDARWLAAAEAQSFDVVVGDLFLPWRTGEGRLFSVEHFEQVRRSLRPGGLFCQWLPLYQLTRPQFDTLCRTFRRVFPEAFVVRGDFYADMPIVGLVGGRPIQSLDWGQIEIGTARLARRADVRDPLVRHAEGVAMLVLGPLPEYEPGPINTLGNNWLEWDAGRNILGMRTPWFIGVASAQWIRDRQRSWNLQLPVPFRAAHESGQFFLTLEVAILSESPLAQNFREQMVDRLPGSLRGDPVADWKLFPSREKPFGGGSVPLAR